MADKLKVTQTTKATGQVGADSFEAKVAGKQGAGSQAPSGGGGCPDCQAGKKHGHKAG